MSFGEHVDPTAAIASVLKSYPFGIGLFREILQNSNDAGATKQIFVLDRRQHATTNLLHEHLADKQGPSLLLGNDALFSSSDWGALQSIYRSSKGADPTKAGKYGMGFRACYHVTDHPQILSGRSLAVFDPAHQFTSSGGMKVDFVTHPEQYSDQLAGFDWFLPRSSQSHAYNGTVIRLPLRTNSDSRISQRAVQAHEIRILLQDFIQDELAVELLFLRHITSIEIYEVDEEGSTQLAKAEIERQADDWDTCHDNSTVSASRCTIQATTLGTCYREQIWRTIHLYFTSAESNAKLMDFTGFDVGSTLQEQKLSADNNDIALAMPLSSRSSITEGRLFTFLPLPLFTGFPCHINAVFALTPARQHLCNSEESGLARESADRVLIEWNRLLFESYISTAWSSLLSVLIEKDNVPAVFDMWPPEQPPMLKGDATYWKSVPLNVVRAVVSSHAKVWPVLRAPLDADDGGRSSHADLASVLVTLSSPSETPHTALTLAGVPITQPPPYIVALLAKAEIDYVELTPKSAHGALLRDIQKLSSVSPTDKDKICLYLLSTGDLVNVTGLPLAPLVAGDSATFLCSTSATSTELHTLFRREDVHVFAQYDQGALNLPGLPRPAADLIETLGPASLNVATLSCERVLGYLRAAFHDFGVCLEGHWSTNVGNHVTEWLVKFWTWLVEWPLRDELLSFTHKFNLIPTLGDIIKSCDHAVFDGTSIDPVTQMNLRQIGLSFVSPAFPAAAYQILRKLNVLKSYDIAHDVLDCATVPHKFDDTLAVQLRVHLSACLASSCRHVGRLSDTQRHTLRTLPIYPVLRPHTGSGNSVGIHEVLCGIAEYMRVESVTDITLLPDIADVTFINRCPSLLPYLRGEDSAQQLGITNVIGLALDHFREQPKEFQCAFLDCLLSRREEFPIGFYTRLADIPFVAAESALPRAPSAVVDPRSTVATLFPTMDGIHSDFGLPDISLPADATIVNDLRMLGLLKCHASLDIVQNRIAFLMDQGTDVAGALSLARHLLKVMIEANFDCSQLTALDTNACWLPTRDGLVRATECHHPSAHDIELFDEILPTLDVDAPVLTRSLVAFLGWDGPMKTNLLKQQFAAVLRSPLALFHKLPVIIKALDHLLEDPLEMEEFRQLTLGQQWIPISANHCVPTSHAVFSCQSSLPSGFSIIPPFLNDNQSARTFLQLMGCNEKPSFDTIIDDLAKMASSPGTVHPIIDILSLLENLDAEELKGNFHRMFVPDTSCRLRPWVQVYFNDLGDRASMVSLPDNMFICHAHIGHDLGKRLGLRSLAISDLDFLDDDDDGEMGELLTTRIKNVLNQYGVEQIFGEFFANAVDAGAKKFGVLVNEQLFDASHVVSPAMALLHAEPSLLIWNDAVFTEKDFAGIRHPGTGGKEGRRDTIGQFGLGALSAYHISEVLMILSGDQVMFLDPSKTRLPQGRSTLKLPLAIMKSRFADDVKCLDSLFGFCIRDDFFNGTIFWLPLRSPAYARRSLMSKTAFNADQVLEIVLGDFKKQAPLHFLFTGVTRITTSHRASDGTRDECWSVDCCREKPFQEGRYLHQIISESVSSMVNNRMANVVQAKWHIASYHLPRRKLPPQFCALVDKHRLRDPIKVGVAASIGSDIQGGRLFSTLPLPIFTALSVHINGSFILAEDRRSIRFDDDGQLNAESQYNNWLLQDLIPPVYLLLLEVLLKQNSVKNWWKWWPGNPGRSSQSFVPKSLVNSFYEDHLVQTKRKVCLTLNSTTITPANALMSPIGPSAVLKVLGHLHPDNVIGSTLPSYFRRSCGRAIKAFDHTCMRGLLLQNSALVAAGYNQHHLGLADIQGVVDYLLVEDPRLLLDTELLPLANGDLVKLGSSGDLLGPRYYAWIPVDPNQNICPLDILVHPTFESSALVKSGVFKVTNLPGAGSHIKALIGRQIQEAFVQINVDERQQAFTGSLWTEFSALALTFSDLSLFPLIPTNQAGTCVSLAHCDDSRVLVTQGLDSGWRPSLLHTIGILTVNVNDCPPPLHNYLVAKFPYCTDRVVLKAVGGIPGDIRQLFSQLSRAEWDSFAQRARQAISSMGAEDLVDLLRRLPIWPAGAPGIAYLAATEVVLLPAGVAYDVVSRFVSPQLRPLLSEHKTDLVRLSVAPWTMGHLCAQLRLSHNTTILPSDASVYKKLLRAMLSSIRVNPSLLVPNSDFVLVPPSELYARSSPIFLAAFETQPWRFVHQSFNSLEHRLASSGLHVNVDFKTFKTAVSAIDNDCRETDVGVQRVRPLVSYYCQEMAIALGGRSSLWRKLDAFRWIPRRLVRRGSVTFDTSRYERPFGKLVTALESLRPELEGVAWTQRAVPDFPADARMLIADPGFGVPSTDEVVEHLRALTSVAGDHPRNNHVLSDIVETYTWLADRHEDVTIHLQQYQDETLFLNVHDPDDVWVWHSAKQLFFNGPDSDDHSQFGVRTFLARFKNLLVAAGVEELKYPDYCPPQQLTPAEDQLTSLRSTLDSMRTRGHLTDVLFESSDGQTFGAHRVFMATVSEHFRALFCGSFRENQTAGVDKPIHVDVDTSSSCLQLCLEYVYQGGIPELESSDDLVALLDLSHYWGIHDLNMEVQRQLVNSHIHLYTYTQLRIIGEPVQATALVEACNLYEAQNEAVIAKLRLAD
ncbi:hypothetical protein BV22DRAFT_1094899 [Leucogyrophana mollusca]|uniref:Uncharacterized protein n=1 Tax=Leucogyrophana mollusca TaxID=85980 RepID=A0ACB8BBG5_9AGAM|nr:hypothetical protein BV22DRAFT_1094899 [Leucogyrophana mollusca]